MRVNTPRSRSFSNAAGKGFAVRNMQVSKINCTNEILPFFLHRYARYVFHHAVWRAKSWFLRVRYLPTVMAQQPHCLMYDSLLSCHSPLTHLDAPAWPHRHSPSLAAIGSAAGLNCDSHCNPSRHGQQWEKAETKAGPPCSPACPGRCPTSKRCPATVRQQH